MIRILLSVLLVGLLTACGGISGPPSQVVKQAIAQHLTQLQQELGQELRLDRQPRQSEISRVKVTEQESLTIQSRPAVRVQGTYDLTVKWPHQTVVERQNPFELYLQRQPEGKTWVWLQPDVSGDRSDAWIRRPIP